MAHAELFDACVPLLRPGGGIAVVTNGTPLWRQDSDWSRALRGFLASWTGITPTYACGTDEQSQREYEQALAAAGYQATRTAVDYVADLNLDQVAGGVLSAMGADGLPSADQRSSFAEQLGQALGGNGPFREQVHVAIVAGRLVAGAASTTR